MKAGTLGLIGLLTASLCGACITVSGGGPDQSMHTYVFEPTVAGLHNAGGARSGVLLVAPPSASSGYDSRFMIYTEEPAELHQYAFSQWADSPSRMLESLLVQTLASSQRFSAVVDISTGVLAELRLDAELVSLRHEIQGPESSRVRIALRVQLVELRTRSVIATRHFEVVEPAGSNDARGGVDATNRALGDLLRQVTEFASEAAAARAPLPPRHP